MIDHPTVDALRACRVHDAHLRTLAILCESLPDEDVHMAAYVAGVYGMWGGVDLPNPYTESTAQHDAWQLAYHNGRRQRARYPAFGADLTRHLGRLFHYNGDRTHAQCSAESPERPATKPQHKGIEAMLELEHRHLFDIEINVGAPQLIGLTPSGERRIVGVHGGRFEGPRLKGTVLDGGGDWILSRPDGALQLDVRITLQTNDEALIYMTYRGIRHGPEEVIERLSRGESVPPSEYYFRITPAFETGATDYAWLNRICAVGVGDRRAAGPSYSVHEIL